MTTKPKNTIGLSDFTQSNDADFRSIARQSRIFELQEAARLAGQEKTKKQNQGVLGDIVDAGQMGALQAGAGMAETAHQITGSEFMGDAAQALNNSANAQIDQMSPEGQQALQRQFFSENENGDMAFGDAWSDPKSYALQLSTLVGQMVPQVAAGFGLGGLGAKVAGNVVAKVAFKRAAAKGLTGDAAKIYATNMTRSAFGTAGQSIAGAGMAGGMVGLQAADEVKEMSDDQLDESNSFRELYYQLQNEMPDLDVGQRRDVARDMLAERVSSAVQSNPALIASNLVLDAAGGFFIDRLLRGIGTGSRLSNAGQQFVAQGATEAGQGGMEQYALNSAMIDEQVDTDRGRMDGVAVNALNEGVMGGMFGAGVGSLRKGQPQQRPLPEPATLDGETDSSGDQASNQANTDVGMQPIDMAPVGDSESFITPPKMSLDDAVEAVKSERGEYRGVDDDIAIAERMGFDDEAVRLRAAKRNFEMAADFANEGDTASAKRFNERALKIYREVTQMGVPELQSAPGSTLPAEYVAVGEFLQRPAELPRGESGEIIDEMETLVPDVEEFQPTDPQLPSPEAVDAPYFTDQTDVPDVEYETGPQEQETVELGAEQPPLPEVEETDLAPLPEVENIDEIPYTPGDVARQPGISLEAEYPGEVVEYAQSDSETMGDSIKDEIRKHKMPKGLDDGRLLRENFRNKLVDMRNSLVAGGGVSYIRDENERITGRTQSINPDWFQNAPDNVRRIGVKNIQVSIDRALKGKSLGRGQARAVKYLLDHLEGSPEALDPAAGRKAVADEALKSAPFGPDPQPKTSTNTETPANAGVSRSVPEVIRNFAGNPFKHRDAARIALKKNPGYEIVQVDGGFELHRSTNDIDEAAKAAALSPDNDIPEPTESQKEAGNYKKAHVKVHGMDIAIENPKGSQRSGTDATGKPWSVTMQHHYGYLKRTKGADGDHVDVFIGPDPESEKIFIIDQVNANGTFDEHKVMLGFKSQADAVRGYKSNYEKGWKVGPVKAVTVSEFKEWLSGDTTKPADDQALTPGSEDSAPAIDDFGEELKGARKHLNRRLLERADNLTDSDIAGSSLSKIWPKSEIDATDDTQAAALHQAIRDEIPTKPRSGYKVRRWVDQVKQVLDLARLADSLGSEAMINQMKMKGGALKNVASRIEVLAGIDRADWSRVGSVRAESGEYKPPNEGKMIPGSWFHVRVDGRRQSFYGASEVAEFIGDLREMLASKPPAAKRLKMSVYTRRSDRSAYIAADADKERRPLREFKNSKDALKALNDEAIAAELEQEWEKIKARSNVSKKDVRGKTNSARQGIDLRNGKDVTPEQFTDAFGFRGVQFGNWVKQGDNGRDRQGMLNQAYDALMDLAEVLGIPPKAISLNGELGLAFGARGSGWAAAHYESGTKVINLTKTQGAGSLAHEWFHALDHYFQGQRQIPGVSAFITQAPENYYQHKKSGTQFPIAYFERIVRNEQNFPIDDWEKVEGVRPKVADAFAAVVQALDASPMLDRSRLIDKGKEDGYWSRVIERAARSFENYVIAKMTDAGKRNEYLANVISVDDFPREAGRYPYLLDSEMKPVAEAFDQLFDAVDTKETEKGVALFSYSGRVSDMAEALRSAGETGSTPEPAYSTIDQVKEWIAATEKMIGTKINVVQNKQDLPNEVIGRIIGTDIHSFIRGFEGVYDTPTDQVYLIAGQIENQSDAIRVVLHEALGHAGVIKMLKAYEATGGAALADVLDTIFRQAGRDVIAREISEYNFDFNDQSERRTAVLEYIAHVAEKGKAMGRVRKVIAALRDFIRRVFPGLRWNETDTLALIEKGRVFLRKERSEEGGATLLSKAPGEYSVKRVATNFSEARQAANDFKGQALKNTETGLVATVSRNNLDKMLSRKAVSKSETAAAHSLAVANLDQLFERAVKGWSKSDRDGNTDIAAVHRFFTPVIKDGKASLVKMTVKEMVREDRNNPLYTVESVEFDERAPAASWVREIAEADGINPREIRSAEAVLSMAQAVEDYNSGQVTDRPLFRLSDAIANDDNLSERQKDFLDKIGPKSMTETAADRFREVTDRWRLKVRQGLVDRFAGLLELDKQLLNGDVTSEQNITQSAWVKARMSNAASGAVSAMMNTGRIYLDEKEGVVDVKEGTDGLVFSLNKLGSAAEVEKFMGWIAANRAEKLAAEGRENLFTSEEIAAGKELNTGVLPDGRNRQDVYDQVFSEFQQHRDDVLAIAEKSGVISSEAREMWRDEFYVPFYRLDEGNDDVSGPRVMGGLSRQQAYKKLKGGTQNLNDLLQNTIMNFHHLIDASMKNLAATQAMDNALALDAAEQTAEAARDKKQSTFILRNGQKVWYNIADPLVYTSLTALNSTGMNGHAMKVMRWFKRTFTNLTTSTPQFIVANMIRDSLSAIAVTDLKANAAGNVASGLKAFGVTDRTGLQRARLMASGGAFSFGHVYGEDADSIRYQIDGELRRASVVRDPKSLLRHGLKPIQAGWDRWQDVNNSVENANRMAAFQQAEAAGKGKLYAAHQARDLMDFSSIGAWPAVRFLIDVVPFLNARLQGLDKLYRSGVKPSAKVVAQMLGVGSVETTVSERKAAARFSAVVGALSVATMALFMHNNDDEDYRKAEDWLKDSYWWFRVPGTEHVVLIPKPFEVGAMATMAERLLQQFVDDKATGQLFRERMGHMLSSTFSFSPVPQLFQPAIDVYSNRDSFTGRDIETMGQQRLSPSNRTNSRTTGAAELISSGLESAFGPDGMLSLSPIQVDYLIGGYFGQVGAWAVAQTDVVKNVLSDVPKPERHWYEYQPIRRFYRNMGDPAPDKQMTMFYDALRESSRLYADLQQYRTEQNDSAAAELMSEKSGVLQLRQRLARVSRKITALNARIKDVQARQNLSSEEKRRAIDVLKLRKNQLISVVIPAIEQAIERSRR